jgi:hypothetical protein
MAIHVPLSAEAQAEARVLMLSSNNILSPASGRPIVTPSQDLIIGGFYLTAQTDGAKGEGKLFRHAWQVYRALDEGEVHLHALIKLVGERQAGSVDPGNDIRDVGLAVVAGVTADVEDALALELVRQVRLEQLPALNRVVRWRLARAGPDPARELEVVVPPSELVDPPLDVFCRLTDFAAPRHGASLEQSRG